MTVIIIISFIIIIIIIMIVSSSSSIIMIIIFIIRTARLPGGSVVGAAIGLAAPARTSLPPKGGDLERPSYY